MNILQKITLCCLLLLITVSCTKDETSLGVVMARGIKISVLNQEGKDLLNPTDSTGFKESEIKIFYVKDGELVEFFRGNYDWPKGYFIYKGKSNYVIRILLDANPAINPTTTYIQWSPTDMDTITAKYRFRGQSVLADEIWVNSQPKTKAVFELVK